MLIFVKRKSEMVLCCDAISISFVSKVMGEVFSNFYAVTIKHHSSMQYWLFGLQGQILCGQFL
jgi:hypothetical protein